MCHVSISKYRKLLFRRGLVLTHLRGAATGTQRKHAFVGEGRRQEVPTL